MKPIRLDLAPEAGKGRAAIGVAILALVAGGVLYSQQRVADADLRAWQRKWERLDAGIRGSRTTAPTPGLREEIERANRVIARLGIPWGNLFAAIDSVAVNDVVLLSVEPDAERRAVRIAAEAKDRTAMLDYLREVQRSARLADGYIVSYQVNSQDPQKPVRFIVSASWPQGPAVSNPHEGMTE